MAKVKKELITFYVGSLVRIRYDGGGELPKELTGEFTSVKEAERNIAVYLNKRDGAKKNGRRQNIRSKSVQQGD